MIDTAEHLLLQGRQIVAEEAERDKKEKIEVGVVTVTDEMKNDPTPLPDLDDRTIDRLNNAKYDRQEAQEKERIAARQKRLYDAVERVGSSIRDELVAILQEGPLTPRLFKKVELVATQAGSLLLAMTDAEEMAQYVTACTTSDIDADLTGLPTVMATGPLEDSPAVENFGSGAMRELIKIAPSLIAGNNQPKLDQLMRSMEIAKKMGREDLMAKLDIQIKKLLPDEEVKR